MNQEDLRSVADRLKNRPFPGKRIFLWVGPSDRLHSIIPSKIVKTMRITDILPPVEHVESDDKKLQRMIKRSLDSMLQQIKPDYSHGQQILIVEDAVLLARYSLEITSFFDWYISDRTMVIFSISDIDKAEKVAREYNITFNKNVLLDYFKSHLGIDNIVYEGVV